MLPRQSSEDKPRCNIANIAPGDSPCLILRVSVTLDRHGQMEQGSAFWHAARRLKGYDAVLRLARTYVELLI